MFCIHITIWWALCFFLVSSLFSIISRINIFMLQIVKLLSNASWWFIGLHRVVKSVVYWWTARNDNDDNNDDFCIVLTSNDIAQDVVRCLQRPSFMLACVVEQKTREEVAKRHRSCINSDRAVAVSEGADHGSVPAQSGKDSRRLVRNSNRDALCVFGTGSQDKR